MLLADFDAYIECQDRLSKVFTVSTFLEVKCL